MQYIHVRYLITLIIVAFFSLESQCQQFKKTEASIRPGSGFDSTQLSIFFKKFPAVKKYAAQTWSFYRKRNYAYAWYNNGLIIEQANTLLSRIMDLQNDGIFKNIPYQNTLDSLLRKSDTKTNPKIPDITFELLLTSQYFFFADIAWQGMSVSVSESVKWHLPRKQVEYDEYLNNILTSQAKQLPLNEPVYRQYELLRAFLVNYRALAAKVNWPLIVATKKPLIPGDSSSVISSVKRRLFLLGDYNGDTLNRIFTNDLITALKQFQERNGLTTDGLPNKATIATLNVPLKAMIKQILVNMERSRWLPVFVNEDYIAVNIPEYQLHVYHADNLLWSCNVVVGKAIHQTTIFYGEVKYVVFSPYWNVPPSIVRNEVIPGMNKNAHYIADHDMEITGYSGGLPVLRQKPGPKNSLGLVKFLFPNSYNIYLHDTPSKSLFSDSTRAFSHGCIRVKEPAKLAAFLLKDSAGWDSLKIAAAMNLGKEQYDTLVNKVPVFIAYFTAFTDRNNHINFRKDVYHLDDHLAAIIMSGKAYY